MFGLMKSFLKEREPALDAVKLSDLHVGCTVGFGFMPQKNINGRRLPVMELNSYLFSGDNFVAFRLEDEHTDINLIIADAEDEKNAYLALSQRIHKRLFPALFVTPLPESWFDLEEGMAVDVAARVLGAPQGWLTTRYTLAMKAQGRLLEGDFRLRNPADYAGLSKSFDYVLFVDEANTHAIEAERYADGTLKVFATVYRPVTDIGEVTYSPRTNPVISVVSEQPVPVIETILGHMQKDEVKSEPETQSRHLVATTTIDAIPVHSKFGRIPVSASTSGTRGEALACDTKLAGRIIDEAQKNAIPLSELIRKVIDLPARISEQVWIPFVLDNAEYAELARRYGIAASDREAVKQRIIEELQQFVGGK